MTETAKPVRFRKSNTYLAPKEEMNMPKVAGYGSWKSPITSNLISSGSKILDVQIEIDDDDIYWVEMRPTEAGRYVIVRRSHDGRISDVTSLSSTGCLGNKAAK